ncbi:MAG: RNase adapter RapZ [Bacteroidota bacterium]
MENQLSILFQNTYKEKPADIIPLPLSGSSRRYFRMIAKNGNHVIGVYNEDVKENRVFLSFTKHFISCGLQVPGILAEDESEKAYLLQDLGDTTLFSFLSQQRELSGFSADIISWYKKAIDQLLLFQIVAGKEIDYSVCYPRGKFDKQSMLWDLNYFKYYFLKLAGISFDEQKLENDFEAFSNLLLEAGCEHFMYRDFQSRNIMIHEGNVWFVDYQGGRKGALQYDLASLLYDAKADIPDDTRKELLDYYVSQLSGYFTIYSDLFKKQFYTFVYIRILQALGAYGFRGFYERKEHFLVSIPYALKNLEWLLEHAPLPVALPELQKALHGMIRSKQLHALAKQEKPLLVRINSFSYKRDIPVDEKGNGGGFVFDCRALPNPGRFEEYKKFTGADDSVIQFLENAAEVDEYMNHVCSIVRRSAENYVKRSFEDLMVSFGCTGGQHRSVYCANRLAQYLSDFTGVEVVVRHREQEFKNI